MPKFTDSEREQVRQALRDTGRELFTRYGIRKTTIAELTESAGIGTGTFYRFYDSKADLYLDIVDRYNEELVPRLLEQSFEAYDDPELAIRALLEATLEEFESNDLFQRVLAEDEVAHVRKRLPDDEMERRRDRPMASFLPYIERWHDAGRLAGPDPETVAHAIMAVARLARDRDRIGEDRYPAVRDTLVAAVAAGLTRETDPGETSSDGGVE